MKPETSQINDGNQLSDVQQRVLDILDGRGVLDLPQVAAAARLSLAVADAALAELVRLGLVIYRERRHDGRYELDRKRAQERTSAA